MVTRRTDVQQLFRISDGVELKNGCGRTRKSYKRYEVQKRRQENFSCAMHGALSPIGSVEKSSLVEMLCVVTKLAERMRMTFRRASVLKRS